jgi:hypothetical protein
MNRLYPDVYATGLALTALAESGAVKSGDPAVRKGLPFRSARSSKTDRGTSAAGPSLIQPYFG